MKLKFLVFTAFLALAFSACNKQNDVSNTSATNSQTANRGEINAELISTYADAGKLHNEGMDFIYDKFAAYKAHKISNEGEFTYTQSEIYYKLNEFTVAYGDSKWSLIDDAQGGLKEYLDDYAIHFCKDQVPFTNDYAEEYGGISMSDDLKDAVDEMLSIGDENITYEAKVIKWNNLVTTTLPLLTDVNEKAGIICGVNVAISSYLYWSDASNVTKWNSLFADGGTGFKGTASNSDHWKCDAAGGVTGAVVWGSRGALFGPGAAVVAGLAGGVLGACQGTGASVVWAKIWSVIGWD